MHHDVYNCNENDRIQATIADLKENNPQLDYESLLFYLMDMNIPWKELVEEFAALDYDFNVKTFLSSLDPVTESFDVIIA